MERIRTNAIEQPISPGFVEKVRVHLAWRIGHGHASQIDAKRINDLMGGKPGSVCVFGCGDLELLVQLRDLGQQVVGIDANERLLLEARSEGVDVWPGSAENPPNHLRTGTFDAVFLNGDLAKARHPKAAVQNARRLLEPGRYLLAEVPNHGSYSARRLGPTWSLWEAGIRLNYFTTKSLSRLIDEGGCEINEILYRRYVAQFTKRQMRDEQEIWDRLYSHSNPADRDIPPRKSSFDLWLDFVRTIFLPPAGKYETVGIISTRREQLAVAQGSRYS